VGCGEAGGRDTGSEAGDIAVAISAGGASDCGLVLKVEKENPGRTIAVVIASMVERHWYHYFLHNQRGQMLTALLLLGGDERINIVNVPWYLKA